MLSTAEINCAGEYLGAVCVCLRAHSTELQEHSDRILLWKVYLKC